MSEVKLAAEPRTEFGKGAARRLRRAHKVPAVLYGHGEPPVHVSLEGHATMLALKNSNALFTLEIDGKTQLALPKDVQRDPLKGIIEHVDLLLVRKGERVTVEIPVQVSGEPIGNTVVITALATLTIEAEATAIPQALEVSVDKTEAGTQIHAKDVALPAGSTLVTEGDALVVHVTGGQAAAGAAAQGEQAEGESA